MEPLDDLVEIIWKCKRGSENYIYPTGICQILNQMIKRLCDKTSVCDGFTLYIADQKVHVPWL